MRNEPNLKPRMNEQEKISPEQETAAKSILSHFENAFRWVILLAQMQSGKSNAYMFLAFELLRKKKSRKSCHIGRFSRQRAGGTIEKI